ncbi:hypothetical protein RAB80_009215 [Fusarium oxysporum f. sp. vasinfectum]|nr:hypothetical protein RAB80_009215 [Fusarium oxysporum f. sp. vasinfectum]
MDRYGVTIDSLPDATAAVLWDELQVRSEELRKQGFEISCGLKPFYSKYYSGGFFEQPLSPQICLLADNFGIKPSDEDGLGPLLRRVRVLGGEMFETEIIYLDWLLKHDVKLDVDTSHLAGCAVHTLTMGLLGIRHVGPCVRNGLNAKISESDEDEWAELLDEDRHLLEKLDDLDEEFEREFQSRNESVAEFLDGYYTERMLEVVREMEAPPADDYRRELLTAGLILGDPDGGNFDWSSDWVTESEDGYDSEREIGEQVVSAGRTFRSYITLHRRNNC